MADAAGKVEAQIGADAVARREQHGGSFFAVLNSKHFGSSCSYLPERDCIVYEK